jgi:hypothetical protein
LCCRKTEFDSKAHNEVVDKINKDFHQLISQDVSSIKHFEANIVLKENVSPVFRKAYTVPVALKPAVEKEIDKQVQQGILRPLKFSKWATPMVVVEKKNTEDVRLCGDFKRTLNPLTETGIYPLPTFEEMSMNWVGCKYFTVIDLKGAYLQVKVSELCTKLLTINNHRGLYEYTRMIYGWAGAPAEFQRIIEQITKDIPGCSAYLDDVCCAGRTKKEALERLYLLLERLAKFNVKINLSKCQFMQPSVEYVGCQLSEKGMLPTQSKFEAISSTEPPTTKTDLEQFLGVLNYYMPHIPNLSTLARPLYDLCNASTDEIHMSMEQLKSFNAGKEEFLSSKALMPYDSTRPIVICTDASPVCTTGVLYHIDDNGKERPVFFTSKSLTPTQQKYPHIEKEGMAIVHAFQKVHKFIYGKEFTLYSDNKPLVYIFAENKPIPITANQRIQRWALMLSAYMYRLKHRKGSDMLLPDYLSRFPLPGTDKEPVSTTNFIQSKLRQLLPLNYSHIAEQSKEDKIVSKVQPMYKVVGHICIRIQN